MNKGCALILLGCLIVFQSIASAQVKKTAIIVSGETHGMAVACDCPQEPGGGLAKRSTAIKAKRQTAEVLLLDGGGFCAGGIYDPYSEGRRLDSIRSIATIHGMARLHYDAIGVGDDDLYYGADWLKKIALEDSLPLVSSNILKKGMPVFNPYRIVKSGGHRIAITAITTPEKLFRTDSTVSIENPVSALKKIWKQMVDKSDYQVVINHCGEEFIDSIRHHFPSCHVLVNSHRKKTFKPVFVAGQSIVMQFGYQGKQLSMADITFNKNNITLNASDWIAVTPDIPDDSAIAKTVSAILNDRPVVVENNIDLYIMSQCPYGLDALREFCAAMKTFPSINLSIWFIGEVMPDSSFKSLHGPAEVADEMQWLAVKQLYPARTWLDFLQLRATTPPQWSTDSIWSLLSLDKGKLYSWIKKNGTAELSMHYTRSVRMGINASPTIVWNNTPFDRQPSRDRIAKVVCTQPQSGALPRLCDSLPVCIDDVDCKQPGKIGHCVTNDKKQQTCVFRDPLKFTFTVLIADSTMRHPEEDFIKTTRDLFPGATIDTVYVHTTRGKQLVEAYKPKALPFYLFDKKVTEDEKYSEIADGVEVKGEKLVFKEGIIKTNYYYTRPESKNSIQLFIDPLDDESIKIISKISSDSILFKSISINPIIYTDPAYKTMVITDRIRSEEALRWLDIKTDISGSWKSYIQHYAQNPGSTYWFMPFIKDNGIVYSLYAHSQASTNRLHTLYKTVRELDIVEPAVIVINNREVCRFAAYRELESFVAGLKFKKTK